MPISVVLCTYNGSLFLEQQVDSILRQTFPIDEIIISDDASSDDTVALVQRLAESDQRIRLIALPANIGVTANFQQAVLATKHDLIAVADQDDIWHEEKIAKLMQAFSSDAVLIYCDCVKFSNSIPLSPLASMKNNRMEGSDPRSIGIFNTVSGHSILFRKKLLEKAIPFPPGVFPDWWLAVMAMADSRLQFLPEILVYHREHNNNMTLQKNFTEQQHRHRFRQNLVRHLNAFRQIEDLTEQERSFFEEGYHHWKQSLHRIWNPGLFGWLMRHHRLIYAYKIRRFPLISAFKNSWLLSFRLR